MKNLRKIRRASNQSQEHVAETIGVTKSTYSKYESGNIPIASNKLVKLVNHFDVSADYLLGIVKFPIKASDLDVVYEIYDDYISTLRDEENEASEDSEYSAHEFLTAEESLNRLENYSKTMTNKIADLKERLYGVESKRKLQIRSDFVNNEERVCAMCRKVEKPNEEFELMYDDREYFKYLCPDCYIEEIQEIAANSKN